MPLYFRLAACVGVEAFELVFQLRKGSFDMNDKGLCSCSLLLSFQFHAYNKARDVAGKERLDCSGLPLPRPRRLKERPPSLPYWARLDYFLEHS